MYCVIMYVVHIHIDIKSYILFGRQVVLQGHKLVQTGSR